MLLKIASYPSLAITCLAIGTCNAFSEILKLNTNEVEVYCAPPIVSNRHKRPLTYFIGDNRANSNEFLTDCLLKNKSVGHSVTLLRHEDLFIKQNDHYTKLRNGDIYPDFGIIMSKLNERLFEKRIKIFLRSPHYVIVYFVITTKNTSFACDESGVFRKDIFQEIGDYMNRFWHRYEMFHSVVEFPFVCPGYYVIFQGKKRSGLRLYDRKIKTVSSMYPEKVLDKLLKSRSQLPISYPVRANIFERFPTAICNCTNINYHLKIDDVTLLNGLCGMDVYIMHDILHYFNFNVSFPDVDTADSFGYLNTTTGQATGSLGQLLDDVFDIQFNSRFMIRYLATDDVQFINYISADSVCAVMRIPSAIPLWQFAYNAFPVPVWCASFVGFVLTGVAAKLLNRIRKRLLNEDTDSQALFGYVKISFFGCDFNKRVPISIIGGTCLMTSVVMLAFYQSNVNYRYTALVKYKRIMTLDELDASNIKIYTSAAMLDMIGAQHTSQFVFDVVERDDLLFGPNIAAITRKADMLLEIVLLYTDDSGRKLLYLVDECYSNFFLSYMARLDFPFIEEIKIFIMHLIEAGLPEAYYRMTANALGLGVGLAGGSSQKTDPRPFFPSELQEFRVAFGLLFVGYLVAVVILVMERWWDKRTSQPVAEDK